MPFRTTKFILFHNDTVTAIATDDDDGGDGDDKATNIDTAAAISSDF
jgi:hypothetical protein